MCVVSMVGDYYSDKYKNSNTWGVVVGCQTLQYAAQSDFLALKKEVEEMKELLLRAKKYDEENNEPHCEMDEKVALLKKVAELVGVSLEEVFGAKQK